ncbi:uridine kinase [Pseudonocardia ailaonensis]|uniref:Uridine kinase n=1 Tax=Pseudonocardia ailaonensis TaxID=367279 RepID=A0ABN2NKD1_9PSEU
MTAAIRPVSRALLATHLADRVERKYEERPGRIRLAIDGPPPAAPDELAAAVVEELRLRGRTALAVRAADFLRPASVRLEYGHHDEEMFLDGWLDEGALRREVLEPAGTRVLPRLWDAERDRAYREEYVDLGDSGVVVLSGALLLGRGLPFEVVAHLHMGRAALGRRTREDERWTLPVFERYARERNPEGEADVLVMADHPERPAMRG